MAYCKSKGGKLVEPKSAVATNDINAIARSVKIQGWGIWIGIDEKSRQGHFRYASDGKSIKYTNWEYGQPDNFPGPAGKMDCVGLREWNNGLKWHDGRCYNIISFMCEREV